MYHARWALISRLGQDDLKEAQRKELEQKRFTDGLPKLERVSGKYLINDQIPMIGHEHLSSVMGKFWPEKTSPSHKNFEMDRFRKATYPCWKPLEDKYKKGDIEALTWLHKADWLIWHLHFEWDTENTSSFSRAK